MRAVIFDGVLSFQTDTRLKSPADGEVLVKVIRAGICETDLQLCQGYMGFKGVLGHEFIGIAAAGRFSGQRVVGEINCACGQCDYCRDGLQNHCPKRTVIGILNHDGAFADSVIVPECNLHVVPEEISDDQAVFVEPVAAACRIPQQISLSGLRQVVVLGDGRLGNLCAQVLRHHGCHVLVVGKHEFKLQLLNSLGIQTCHINDLPPRRTADLVVDCTGSPSGLTTALQVVRPRGTVVLKTTVAAAQSLHLAPVVIDEITVVGSRCGPFEDAISLLASGAVRVDEMISARYPLERAEDAFRHAVRKDALKVLFDVSRRP